MLGLATDALWTLTCLQNGVRGLDRGRDVEVRPSPGKGLGVFAARPIAAGTLITRGTGTLRSSSEQAVLTDAFATSGLYAWSLGPSWVVDADDEARSGWARYINHSVRRQNCAPVFTDPPEGLRRLLPSLPCPFAIWFETQRDIAEGEELLYDYGTDYWDGAAPLSTQVQQFAPRGSAAFWLNARLNPRRLVIDWL